MIELLIVIAILAVLAGIIFALINPLAAIKKAKNSQRYYDMHNISNALEVYLIDNQCYPASLSQLTTNGVYLKTLPKDPETGLDYPYEAEGACPQWVVLYGSFYKKMITERICPLPLDYDPNCKPVNYDRGDDYMWGCSILGSINCESVKTYVLPENLEPTPTQEPTSAPTNTPTATPSCSKDYVCTGGPPTRCNLVSPGTGTYCALDCNGECEIP